MANSDALAPSAGRRHIVLVPGFAGFDVLGQLEYYARITPLFQKQPTGNQVLHYFDNFPTAAVVTRATRLRGYLAKRIARGDISKGDDVMLVGHSTGGLDIRWLLWDLHHRKKPIVVDGGAEVKPATILEHVRRVVFLSVPHWGTNIADWVRSHAVWREAILAELRAAVAGSQVLLLDRLEGWIAAGAADATGAGLLRAVEDALSEANEYNGTPGPVRTAEAQEAASELALYLRHMAADFRAIDDLTAQPPGGEPESPAHFDRDECEKELQLWRDRGIEALSYVTVGRRPFQFDPERPAPVWELTKPWTYPEFAKDGGSSVGTDIVYRTCYRACAGGPLQKPDLSGMAISSLGPDPQQAFALWDNDGIVNTVSMFWPEGDNVLVPADHMDIVGHYKPAKALPGEGRTYQAYDLLKSASGFSESLFKKVWNEIFFFCVHGARPGRTLGAMAAGE